MATKTPRSHVVRAASLAHAIFAPPDDTPPPGSAYKNVSISVPLGLLSRIDCAAKRSGSSRSATFSLLADAGMGLVLEQMTPKQMRDFLREADAPSGIEADGVPADARFQAVEG
jgi:hypothetical protein